MVMTIMKTVKASEFKATCLALMDEIEKSGEEIVITKNGRPVSRLLPYRERAETLYEISRGTIEIRDDAGLLDPVSIEWEAES